MTSPNPPCTPSQPDSQPRLRHVAEDVLFRILLGLARLVGLEAATAVGAFIGRTIGPLLGRSRLAVRNLRMAFPEMSEGEARAIGRAMWDNLGRTAAEYAHLDRFKCYEPGGRIEVVGAEHFDAAIAGGKGAVFVAGHFANWELLPMAGTQRGGDVAEVYRAANNPLVDRRIVAMRKALAAPVQVPKGNAGARSLISHLKRGGIVAMLVDQRMSDGVAVPFFGREAMTPAAPAQLALKFGCPIIPAHIERLAGSRFRIRIHPPIAVAASGDQQVDVLRIMTELNRTLEGWIRDRPEQWLWLHDRWQAAAN